MSDNLPILLEPDEELIDIDTVEINLNGKKEYEEIKWRGHPNIVSRTLSILIGIFLIFAGILLFPFWIIFNSYSFLPLLGIFSIISGIGVLFSVYIYLKYTRYVITDSALYRQTGWLSDNVKRVPVDNLQSIEYRQSILERILNFGSIEVSTAGTDGVELFFDSVTSPKKVHRRVNNLMEERVRRPKQFTTDDQIQRIRDLEDELDRVRRNVED